MKNTWPKTIDTYALLQMTHMTYDMRLMAYDISHTKYSLWSTMTNEKLNITKRLPVAEHKIDI